MESLKSLRQSFAGIAAVRSSSIMRSSLCILLATTAFANAAEKAAPAGLAALVETHCADCHDATTTKGSFDITALKFELNDARNRERWVRVIDRVQSGEMPPKKEKMPEADRAAMVRTLDEALFAADSAEVAANGRGPLRRLNRLEYEQNLRDLLHLPDLDIRDILPEDREGHRFNKTTEMLDMSRVQLTAYLDAAEAALRAAKVTENAPSPVVKKRIVGTDLFPGTGTFGNREAMFFARGDKAIDWGKKKPKKGKENYDDKAEKDRDEEKDAAKDETIEMALFRSASWPYLGIPKGFVAKHAGRYRVRFSARSVLQQPGFTLLPAKLPVPMTFRTRKPAGVDIINEVRADGGVMDILPEKTVHETTIRLRVGESFEYSVLGLPMPLAMNPNGSAPSYRYPPFPEGGQPGVCVQWVEVEGPLAPETWPPPSHRVLFDELGIHPQPANPREEAHRLLRRFVKFAAREPIGDDSLGLFDALIAQRLEKGATFSEAMLAGFKAFLASGDFIYLREPRASGDHFAIASRLSHFLTNSRPDARLFDLAAKERLRDPATLRDETARLMASEGFERFVQNFTDCWVNLRQIRRDDPDIRLFPEYRFDEYLVESMERETRAFFTAMIRDNLPASVLVASDFVFANDRLAKHYELPPITGSELRKVALPAGSPFGGLLTQGAILKVSANGTTTSPVVRGAWVMERLIGRPPPAPPASVPAVEPDIRGAKTIRDLLARHTKDKSCAACHAKFDPVGLALESFDILGSWRTRYRGLEEGERMTGIDRAGHDFSYTLSAPVDSAGQLIDGRTFKDVNDLKKLLTADNRQLARNLLHQFTIYATGTPVRYSDRREIETMLDACAADGYGVRSLMMALVQSRLFMGGNAQ